MQSFGRRGDLWGLGEEDEPDPGSGGHRREGSISLEAILAAFVPTFITAVVYLAIFLQIRGRYPNLYSSRTYKSSVPKKDRTPQTGLGKYDWFQSFRRLDEKYLLRHSSLDVFLFMRFLRSIIFICFVGCCITWPILFPVNATGGGESSELDRISFSNVTGKTRLYAHAAVAWVFLGFVMFTVARERVFLRELRQAYYLSKPNSELLSSRTVLFMHTGEKSITNDNLEGVFGEGARKAWPVADLSELEGIVADRNNSAMSLEYTQVQFIKNMNKRFLKGGERGFDAAVAEKKARPNHRVFPLVGQKVDAISWHREKVLKSAEKIQSLRESYESGDAMAEDCHAAVFVEYATQAAARRAYHQLSFGRPLQLDPRYIGIQPKEVLWKNLRQRQAQRLSKKTVAAALVAAIIIFWAIPVSIIGTISNVAYLADRVSWLGWINKLPPVVLGLLTGLLPPFLVSWVISYVPKLFRRIARNIEPTTSSSELLAQAWYFAFQLIQVFLITTVTSGAAAVATKIAREPKIVPDLLAENLPKASNFYITYFILQGTASASQNVLNYSDLFEYIGYDLLFDRTPRAKYDSYMWMKGISWCSVFPKFANFAVIAIAYSCIAPLMLGFAAAGVYLYYLSYRYNFLFVVQPKIDTKGEAYALALQHVLTGVYISELCLIGLFGIRRAPGPSIMMAVLLGLTILYHLGMNRLLKPVEKYLPRRLRQEDEEAPLVSEDGDNDRDGARQGLFDQMKSNMPGWVPTSVVNFLERFIMPDANAQREMCSWFEEDASDIALASDDQRKNAYLNPALTSKTPVLWLLRDGAGISRREMEENEKTGISSTDDGAELDDKNRLVWDRRDGGSRVPVFKEAVKY